MAQQHQESTLLVFLEVLQESTMLSFLNLTVMENISTMTQAIRPRVRWTKNMSNLRER